jgi:hypothetical protein
VRPSQREQTALDGMLCVRGARQPAQALRDDGADSRQGVFDTVVQFLKYQLLQFVGRLTFLGVEACQGKRTQCIDFGLRKQKPKAEIFCGPAPYGNRLEALPIALP